MEFLKDHPDLMVKHQKNCYLWIRLPIDLEFKVSSSILFIGWARFCSNCSKLNYTFPLFQVFFFFLFFKNFNNIIRFLVLQSLKVNLTLWEKWGRQWEEKELWKPYQSSVDWFQHSMLFKIQFLLQNIISASSNN